MEKKNTWETYNNKKWMHLQTNTGNFLMKEKQRGNVWTIL